MKNLNFFSKNSGYNGKRVKVEEVTYTDSDGKVQKREHVIVKHASCLLAETSDGKFVFIKQFRTAVGNKELWELPAGLIEENEVPYEAAIREFKEETGFSVNSVECWPSYYASCGYTNEIIHLFYSNNISDTKIDQSLDEDESIDVVFMEKEKALELLKDSDVMNGALVTALLYYKAFKC